MKKNIQILAVIWVALTLLTALSACQTPAGRSAGTVVDDTTITAQAKAKLLADNELSGLAISVETFEGDVTLNGAVDNHFQRKRAKEIVQSVSGVHSVHNLLKIK